jgi:hypothetical protein
MAGYLTMLNTVLQEHYIIISIVLVGILFWISSPSKS